MKMLLIALLCFLLLCLCACVATLPERTQLTSGEIPAQETMSSASTKESALKKTSEPMAFSSTNESKPEKISEVLEEHCNKSLEEDSFVQNYAFHDTKDGKISMLVISGEGSGGKKLYDSIYSVQNDIAIRQEQFLPPELGHNLSTTLFLNGIIMNEIDDAGSRYYAYYGFENGVLTYQAGLLDEGNSYYCCFPDASRNSLTKAEFDRVKKEFEGDGQVVELDWKPLAEYGR